MQRDRRIAVAAARYVQAMREAQHCNGSDFAHVAARCDETLHELLVLLDIECWLCEPGTCPNESPLVLQPVHYATDVQVQGTLL